MSGDGSRNQRRKGGAKRGRVDEWLTDNRIVDNLQNAAFEKFYRGMVVPEDEWEQFMSTLRTGLPTALRVNVALPNAVEVLEFIRGKLASVLAVTTLPFFPRSLGLQCSISRGDLKRNEQYRETKKIVAALNEGGYLTRQETVSMVPPLLLNVQPGHRVLDMCAAPGSKTSQLLEVITLDNERGVVVANDLNVTRLDVLHHQTNRCMGAHAHLIITNYDASKFPLMQRAEDKFDRVLCDVMCSGDGTLRKSVDMWPRWNTLQGADLHMSQIRILTRGMMLCKKGGFVVYSTCSLNPVEDEAVLSECIRLSKGSFRLVDPTPFVPGLIACDGKDTWSLTTKDLSATLASYEEAQAHQKARAEASGGSAPRGFQYRSTMFPDTTLLREQNIFYAKRILPHLQDTGGFFVALLECVEDYPESLAPSAASPNEHAAGELVAPPFHRLPLSLHGVVRDSLGLPESFPVADLFLRNDNAREQKLYYACSAAAELVEKLGPKVVSVGAKVIESYSKYRNDKLRFSRDSPSQLAALLPTESPFVIPVEAALLLDLANTVGGMAETAFVSRVNRTSADLPNHSFLVRCDLPIAGCIFAPVERTTFNGLLVPKVSDWQKVLAQLAMGLPIAPLNDVKRDASEGDDVEGVPQGSE